MKPFKNTIIGIVLFITIGYATSHQYEVIGHFNDYTLVNRKGDVLIFKNVYFKPPTGTYIRLYFDWDWTYKHSPKLNDLINK